MVTKKPSAPVAAVPLERINQSILWLRGQKVMLDADLADLDEVEIRVLNQAVKRNSGRFPSDFMFQLTTDEADSFKITDCDLRAWAWAA